jgi:hypothetical protein
MKTVNGIEVGDYVPMPCYTQRSGVALVVGTAPDWIDELVEAKIKFPDAPVFAVNVAGRMIICNYWVTVHPEKFGWGDMPLFSDKMKNMADVAWPIATAGGSSALLATLIALVMGFDMVVMAGVHLIGEYKQFQPQWLGREEQINGRVRSVSPEGTFIRDHFGGLES